MPTKLNLSRDQLASFLKSYEQIKQFENLFSVVDSLLPSTLQDLETQAGNADQKAVEALDEIKRIVESISGVSIQAGNADQKAAQALSELQNLASSLRELLLLPPTQNNNSISTDYVDFTEVPPEPVLRPGRLHWNKDEGTLNVDIYNGNRIQVGQETLYYAKNDSGGTISIGTPVMFSGTVGASAKLEFVKAVADGTSPGEYMLGVASETIASNAYGYITEFGIVRGFNTTGSPYGEVWTDGDLLYFDPAVAGTWTNVRPVAPAISVPVAFVLNAASGGSGSIFVRMELSELLNNLQDVYINGGGPSNYEILMYDSANSRWHNVPGVTRAKGRFVYG